MLEPKIISGMGVAASELAAADHGEPDRGGLADWLP